MCLAWRDTVYFYSHTVLLQNPLLQELLPSLFSFPFPFPFPFSFSFYFCSSFPMPPPAWHLTRVIKKIAPAQPGARKLSLRYGRALVCVRHRHDPEGKTRYTTVELVVEQTPIVRRRPRPALLCVRLDSHAAELRRQLMAEGGQWDPEIRAWWVNRETVKRLRLMDLVVSEGPL